MLEWAQIIPSKETVETLKAIANSNFTTSLAGALAGAFFGAWAAQRVAEKAKSRELLLNEIRQLNMAATLLNSIANTGIVLKKQHVKRLREEYEEARGRLVLFLEAKEAGRVPPKQVFDFRADMETLSPPFLPTGQVARLVFDEVSVPRAVPFVFPHLLQSIQTLRDSLEQRNTLIAEWKATKPDPEAFAFMYFGFAYGQVVDRRYATVVQNIYESTDDVIAFSMMLAEALLKRARHQRDTCVRRFGRSTAPPLSGFDFKQSEAYVPKLAGDLERFKKSLENGEPEQVGLLTRLLRKIGRSSSSAAKDG